MDMKLITLLLIISLPCFGQPYILMGGTNNGVQLGIGTLSDKIDIQVRYQLPLFDLEAPKILSFNVGRMINLTTNEEDNLSITPSVGYGYFRSKDFTHYNNPEEHEKIINGETFKPIYGIELGKDWFMGRACITYYYSDRNYIGGTIRYFFSR